MDADGSSTSEEFRAVRHTLGRNIKFYPRTSSLLNPEELEVLHRHRRQFTPSRNELKLIFSSMRLEESPSPKIKIRQYDLGWYWFRNMSQTEFVSFLTKIAKMKNPLVSWPAVNLLGCLGLKKTFEFFKTLVNDLADEVACEAVKGLAHYPPERAIPALLRISLNDRISPMAQGKAVKMLASLGDAGISPLIQRFKDDDSDGMRQLAVVLMAEGWRPNDEVLQKLARDRSGWVRRVAMVALAKSGRDADRQWFIEIAQENGNADQPFAVRALAEFADPRDLPLLSALALKRRSQVASTVADVLWQYPRQETVDLIRTLVTKLRCWQAVASLVRLPTKLTVRTIRELAKNSDGTLRCNLANHLFDWKHPDACKILRQMSRDREPEVRHCAAFSLGGLGLVEDLPLWRKMCRDKSECVRRIAVWNVGKFMQQTDIPLLKNLALDSSLEVSALASRSLADMATRKEVLQWLDENIGQLGFKALKELDYRLYAPRWLRKAEEFANDDESLRWLIG